MPKCENCYHYEACDARFDVEAYGCKCEDYKDKSLIVELPCKVGDTVYIQYKKKIYPVSVYAIRYDTKTNNKRICVEGWLQIDECYQHEYLATFKWESVGKTVFLTREEAEKALKEREQHE